MTGEIILDIEQIHLKELNEIIIAVENHHYTIIPIKKLHGSFVFILKPAEEVPEVCSNYETAVLPETPAADSYCDCAVMY